MSDEDRFSVTRRHFLAVGAAGAVLGTAGFSSNAPAMATAETPQATPAFGYCLNTSTVRGANLGIDIAAEIAAKAGFNAIEPWISELEAFEKKGGTLKDLGKKFADLGLKVPSAIGFAKWIVDDESERSKALEQMKRDMEKVALIGGTHIAAPASGANKPDDPKIDLHVAAERYAAVCKVGDQTGVVPQVEVWGFSNNLTRLADAMAVAIGSGHAKACVLADVYHLYKGGSDPNGLRLVNGRTMSVVHFNDYPADPPREKIADAMRVYPGDGVAPLGEILQILRETGFTGYLSLELFNKDYWKQAPPKVAETGLAKMKASVAAAFGHAPGV